MNIQASSPLLDFATEDCHLIVDKNKNNFRAEIWYEPHIDPEQIIFILLSAISKDLPDKDKWFLLDEDLDISGRECRVYSIPVVTKL
jgi:hypothetical protein